MPRKPTLAELAAQSIPSQEEYTGTAPTPYEKSTGQKWQEALAALAGVAGTATNAWEQGYGRRAPVSQPFEPYSDLVAKAGKEQQASLAAQQKYGQDIQEYQRWAPGEFRSQYGFLSQYGPEGEKALEQQYRAAAERRAQAGETRAEAGETRQQRAEAMKLEREANSQYYAEKDRLENIIKNPKMGMEDKAKAHAALTRLKKGEIVTKEKEWWGLSPEQSEKVSVPLSEKVGGSSFFNQLQSMAPPSDSVISPSTATSAPPQQPTKIKVTHPSGATEMIDPSWLKKFEEKGWSKE